MTDYALLKISELIEGRNIHKQPSDDARHIPSHISVRALYAFIWQANPSLQILICLLAIVISPLPIVYLELQRRIVDEVIPRGDVGLLAILASAYFAVILIKSLLKYGLNMAKGIVVETVARNLRLGVLNTAASNSRDSATLVTMLSAETDDLSGFAGEAFATPLLDLGTILYVAGYLLWVQPAIAVLAVIVYLPQAVIVPVTQHSINRLARLRIQLTRFLGRITIGSPIGLMTRDGDLGRIQIERLYRVRIWIYLRKFFLSELGNFLNNFGPLMILTAGGYFVMTGEADVGILIVFISGLQKFSDPWDEMIGFYRTVSNAKVGYSMIRDQIQRSWPFT